MKLYRAVKTALAVALAILLAEAFQLSYSTTAGIIALLSLQDTRKQTYLIGLKRVFSSIAAILFASLLFEIFGHSLLILGIFITCFLLFLTLIKSIETFSVSLVLVTHIYTLQRMDLSIALNEILLLLIAILVAVLLNLHMPNSEKKVKKLQRDVEEEMKSILYRMALLLINQCDVNAPKESLERLKGFVNQGIESAVVYNYNYVWRDNSYYVRYFQMRKQQTQLLGHMEKYFTSIFIAYEQALLVSCFTEEVVQEFHELNTAENQLKKVDELLESFRQMPLPKTREEFESRAGLFSYLNDLRYFLEIKKSFMKTL